MASYLIHKNLGPIQHITYLELRDPVVNNVLCPDLPHPPPYSCYEQHKDLLMALLEKLKLTPQSLMVAWNLKPFFISMMQLKNTSISTKFLIISTFVLPK